MNSVRSKAVQPFRPLQPNEVLYMEDGGPKRCDRCMMFIKDTGDCAIHASGTLPAKADKLATTPAELVCYLYVPGKPMETGEAVAYVTPEESGLGFGNTTCGNCVYGSGRPTCAHPALVPFAISNEDGCCNAWTGRMPHIPKKVPPPREPDA